MSKDIISITPTAIGEVKHLLSKRGKPSYGVRLGTKTKGCNGLSYTLEYADAKEAYDEEILCEGVKVLIDPKAIMFLMGTEMDYQETDMESGFVFTNPNEKGRCGCGESFHV